MCMYGTLGGIARVYQGDRQTIQMHQFHGSSDKTTRFMPSSYMNQQPFPYLHNSATIVSLSPLVLTSILRVETVKVGSGREYLTDWEYGCGHYIHMEIYIFFKRAVGEEDKQREQSRKQEELLNS